MRDTSRTTRVAAGSIFMDSWDIMPYTVANLVRQGITDIFLIDHRSERDSGAKLLRQFEDTANVRLVRKNSIPFFQGRMVSLLAEVARGEGFDAFLPFDSDEFIDTRDHSTTFESAIRDWLEDPHAAELLIPEVDYVQSSAVSTFEASSLSTCCYRAAPAPLTEVPAQGEFVQQTTRLRRPPSAKAMVNLRAVATPHSLSFEEGSHRLTIQGQLPAPHQTRLSQSLVIRHLPFRSREQIMVRAEHGRRRLSAGFSTIVGWQNARLADLRDEDVERHWLVNSWSQEPGEAPLVRQAPEVVLEEDLGLCELLMEVEATWLQRDSNEAAPPCDAAQSEDFAQKLLDAALDSHVGFPALQDALNTVHAIEGSRIWRYTAFYRNWRSGAPD